MISNLFRPGLLYRGRVTWLAASQAIQARHTCATLMHLQGVPVAVIAAWIGHQDASLTMKLCAHSQDGALMAAGATLNRVVTSLTPTPASRTVRTPFALTRHLVEPMTGIEP